VSVDALQERLICEQLATVAVRPVGTDGAVLSGFAPVEAEAVSSMATSASAHRDCTRRRLEGWAAAK
jgi:hypothetical protein